MSFQIITDSASNLPKSYADKNNVEILSLKYTLAGVEFESYVHNVNDDSLKSFYGRMREKASTSTANVNAAQYEECFVKFLEEGKDILNISLSSGLSSSYSFAKSVSDELTEKYPDRKIYAVDSLSVTSAQGLLVDNCVKMRDEGKTIDEVYNWLESVKLKMCHLFTVDDLVYLKRGGRISPATAMMGTLLGVKPLMRVSDEGKLEKYDKVQGRKKALTMLVEKMKESITDPAEQTVALVHGDCIEDAEFTKSLIMEKVGVKEVLMDFLTPIIGAHSGPGTIAFFYFGKNR
jgi:DegV family protein with EDD domain